MKSILYLFVIAATSIFPVNDSMSFDMSKETVRSVVGRVVNERNFPVPFAKVIINNAEVETDKSGVFRIPNVTFPYDAVVAVKTTATAVLYKKLSIDNPELILFGKSIGGNAISAAIEVTFPEIPSGSSAILKFISTDSYYSEEKEVFHGEKSKSILVYWPATKNILNGNVVFIQRSSTDYQQYSEKVVSIFKNSAPFKANITAASSANIKTSDLVVYVPFKDYTTKGYSIFANFQSYKSNADVLLTKEEGDIHRTKSIIPSSLPVAYRLKISGFVDFKDGSGFTNYVYSQPGATVNLETETPPEPQTPSDNFLGANGNTEFYYSLGSGTGIFVVEFHSAYPAMSFYIVTDQRSTNFSYLSRREFKNAGSVEFKWRVKKYLTYFSVNDFVKPAELRNDIGYKAVLYSKERIFKTGYY
jgi:hypothetical protein